VTEYHIDYEISSAISFFMNDVVSMLQNVLETVSGLLDKKSLNKWMKKKRRGDPSVAKIFNKIEDITEGSFCRIEYTNESSPMKFIKKTKNLSKNKSNRF